MLNDRLSAFPQSRATAEVSAAYDECLAYLDAGGVAENAVKTGDRMPDFLLPNAEGRLVGSNDLLKVGPVIVAFFRGDWCPYCIATLEALEVELPKIVGSGGTLLAITPETGGRALMMKRTSGLTYDVLIDVDLTVAMAFGIVFRMPPLYTKLLLRWGTNLAERSGNPAWLLPIPAVFVVRSDGIIARSWVNIDFTQRAEPSDIVATLKSL